MIKLKYGTDSERNALATEYLGIYPDIANMRSEWISLRSMIVSWRQCRILTIFNFAGAKLKKKIVRNFEFAVAI